MATNEHVESLGLLSPSWDRMRVGGGNMERKKKTSSQAEVNVLLGAGDSLAGTEVI